ncbi:Ig-like domain-containing protein, partial [Listeria grandensis]|uniref:Ig-like domain-containing protein n=1 Tax=Listeria grandensis TaxID=1494963 RepID=UPI00164E3A1E
MSTKKNIIRKSGTIALATVLIGSSLLSTIPANVFASEEALKNVVSEAALTAAPANATEVATSAELRTALLSTTITDIKLTADIKLTTSFNFTTQKNLYGNGHSIDMDRNRIGVAQTYSINRIEDLTITNQDIYPLFWSEYNGVQVTYKDVTSNGRQFVYNANGTTILEGDIKATATQEEVYQGKNLLIKEGANVDFSSIESNGTALYVNGNLTQEANSNMKVDSKSYTLYVANNSAQISIAGNMELKSANKQAIYATGGSMIVKTGASFKADAGDPVEEGISITNGSLTVEKGADFVANSKGLQGTVQTGKTLIFENGSNFAITNTNATGSVFANYAGASTKININSDKGLSTWDYGFIYNDKPTHNYNDFKTATFDLSGWDKGNLSQKNLMSNSAQFQSQFVSKTTGKLLGGSYALTNIAQTKIEDLTTDSTHVVGLAEPNATIVIKNATGTILASGRVGSDGYYDVTIAKQAAGTVVTATADYNGITSSASTTVIQAAIKQTTIAPTTTDSTKATGTAEPNADIEIKANGEVIGSGKVGSDGNYSITISQQDVGTRVTAMATKGIASSYATTTVTQGDLDQTTISALTTKSTVAEGTAQANASVEIKNSAGDVLGFGKIGSDGKYSVTIPKQAAGTVVIVTATSNGKTSTAQTTVVRGEIDETTVNDVTTESVSVSGTAEPNATIIMKDQDGKQLATGRVGSDGIYSLTIAKQPEGMVISITASLAGFTSTASTIVVRDGIDQTTINSLTTDSVFASGTAEPNATIIMKDQDGKQLATGRVGSDGIYSLTIAKQAEGTVVTAIATKDGKTSSANTIVVQKGTAEQDAAKKAVDALFTDATKTGIKSTTDQAAIDAAQTLVNKVQDPTAKADLQKDLDKAQSLLDAKNEKAKQDAAKKAVDELFVNDTPSSNVIKSTTDQAAVDAAQALVNKVTDPTKKAELQKDLDKAKAQLSSNGTLKPDDFVLGTTSITGSYSGDVDRITLSKDGVESGNATKSNGTFRFYVGPGIKKDQSLYMVAYDKNGREIAREKVNFAVVTAGQITPKAMTIPGDSNISGTYTGDVARIEVTITNEAGVSTVYKGGTVANGTFRFYSFDKTKSPKDIIVVRAY